MPDDGFGSALLVTADGAVDTSMDPNKQELITASLHYCEIVAALGEALGVWLVGWEWWGVSSVYFRREH